MFGKPYKYSSPGFRFGYPAKQIHANLYRPGEFFRGFPTDALLSSLMPIPQMPLHIFHLWLLQKHSAVVLPSKIDRRQPPTQCLPVGPTPNQSLRHNPQPRKVPTGGCVSRFCQQPQNSYFYRLPRVLEVGILSGSAFGERPKHQVGLPALLRILLIQVLVCPNQAWSRPPQVLRNVVSYLC